MFLSKNLKPLLAASTLFASSTLLFQAIAGETKKEEGSEKTEKIQVTGSRIKRTDYEPSAPVLVLGQEDIQKAGYTRIEDIMNTLPQLETANTAFISNGTDGTATLDLRGLGPSRTLVLLNGRRINAGRLLSDVNQIPARMIKRVEIMTGGGASTYGADAVAGVINFILREDVNGVEISVNGSGYQHNNRNKDIVAPHDARKFSYPKGDTGLDGKGLNVNGIIGGMFADGRGNATAYMDYRSIDSLLLDKRDYSNCAIGTSTTKLTCSGSQTNVNPNFYIYPSLGGTVDYDTELYSKLNANSVFVNSTATDVYNFNPVNYFQRPNEKYSLGAIINLDINDHAKPYTEVSYLKDRTVAQIAESGTFFKDEYTIDLATTTALTAAQIASLRAQLNAVDATKPTAGTDADELAIYIGKRSKEADGRQYIIDNHTFRMVSGVKGDLFNDWTYDAHFMYASNSDNSTSKNDMYLPRAKTAILDGTYKVFTYNGVTTDQTTPLLGTGIDTTFTTQKVFNAYVTGDLPFNIPTATNAITTVIGVENRSETYKYEPDEVFYSALLAGMGGKQLPLEGAFAMKEAFAEFKVPVIEDMMLVKGLNLDLGYRLTDHTMYDNRSTYKVAGDWVINDDWKVRTSYNRAVRAPNMSELFRTKTFGLWNGKDPCSGATPLATYGYSQADCAKTGMTAAQYGVASNANSANQYYAQFGGNLKLNPEVSNTFTGGIVANPIEDLNFSVDFWTIKIEDQIAAVNPQLIIEQCIKTGSAKFCDKIHRGLNGTLKRTPTISATTGKYVSYVENWVENVGTVITTGVDVSANHHLGLFSGKLNTSLNGTLNMKKYFEPVTGLASSAYECSGKFNASCFPQPKWRHIFSVQYQEDIWAAKLRWRYLSEIKYLNPTGTKDFLLSKGIDAHHYLDLVGDVDVMKNVKLMVGVNNILDKEPPLLGDAVGYNGNVIPGFHDTLGRFFFTNVTMAF